MGHAAGVDGATENLGDAGGWRAWPGAPGTHHAGHVAWVGELRGSIANAEAAREARGAYCGAALLDGGIALACARRGRPLYYTVEASGRRLVACSRLAPLLATRTSPPAIDDQRLLAHLARVGSSDPGETLYKGIRVLRARELVAARLGADGHVDVTSEILPPSVATTPMPDSPDGLADALRALVEESVDRAISGARRAIVMGGGGVDSSAVLATALLRARRAGGPDVIALVIDEGKIGDDRPYVRKLAEALSFRAVYVGSDQCSKTVARALIVDQQPVSVLTFGWTQGLFRAARELEADVVLTGVGGDELFDGDLRVFVARAKRGRLLSALADVARLQGIFWLNGAGARVEHLLLRPLARDLLPSWFVDAVRTSRRRRRVPAWHGPVLRDFVEAHRASPSDVMASALAELSSERSQCELLGGCARIDPLVDDDIVDFAARIPPELLFHGRRRRGLFRHAFRGVVPDSVRLRPDKSSPTSGFRTLFGGPAGELFRSLSSARALSAKRMVEPRAFAARFREVAAGDDPRAWDEIWPVLALEAFLRAREEGVAEERAAQGVEVS